MRVVSQFGICSVESYDVDLPEWLFVSAGRYIWGPVWDMLWGGQQLLKRLDEVTRRDGSSTDPSGQPELGGPGTGCQEP